MGERERLIDSEVESLHNERSGTELGVSANLEQILRFIAPDSYIIIEPKTRGG